MKRIFVILLALTLFACAHPAFKEMNDYVTEGEAKAMRGEMAWSDFYKGYYKSLEALPAIQGGKGFWFRSADTMIQASLAMESGHMSLEQFHSMRRQMAAAEEDYEAALAQHARQQFMETFDAYLKYELVQIERMKATRPLHCISNGYGAVVHTSCH